MVKQYILLSILSITFISAEEFAFVCDDVNSSSDIPQSLNINTKKEYVIFFKNKHKIFVNKENFLRAEYKYTTPWNGSNFIEFDKVSGWLELITVAEDEVYKKLDTSGIYICEKAKRLMD